MHKSTLALVFTLPALAGCGVLTETQIIEAKANSILSDKMPGDIYAPIYNDGETTLVEAIDGDGINYFVGQADGHVAQMNVRFNEDRTIAYVAVDGGEEVEYATRLDYSESTSSLWGRWENEAGEELYLSQNKDGSYPGYLNLTGDDGLLGRGRGGLETPIADLPSGTASYGGYFYMNGPSTWVDGSMLVDADFEEGRVFGGMLGNYSVSGETYEYGSFSGTVDGTISGGRVGGTATMNSGAEGEFDMLGAIYGADGNVLAGGIAGTLTTESGDHAVGGDLYLYEGGGFFR